MADGDKLRALIDEIIRESAETQAKAYHEYGGLLDRLAKQDIESVEFAREAVDLYVGALGKAATTGVSLLGESIMAGIKGVGEAASAAADAARIAEKEAEKRAEKPKAAPKRGPRSGSATPV
jgi:hypothetical protein